MEQPPIIRSEPAETQKFGLGRIGLFCSLAALGALAVLFLFRPG